MNAARQSWLLTKALQEQIGREARENRLANLPPVLAFQSVMDSTVSTRAVVSGLFDQLPANGSELVVFDINRRRASVRSLNRRPDGHHGAAAGRAETLRCHDYH